MLKELLLSEASTIKTDVKLDSIFESVEMSETEKTKFHAVFESAVKTAALSLAESHINDIAEKAETQLDEKVAELNESFKATADKLLTHIAEEWKEENQLQIESSVKATMFDSVMVGLKTMFVEHNVVLPEESVDVVAELEDELTESHLEAKNLFEQVVALKSDLTSLKRGVAIAEATKDLTLVQKEKVTSLVEGLTFDDNFATKLTAIVEMTAAQKTQEKPLTENVADDAKGLNYQNITNEQKEQKTFDPMAQFVNAI